MNRDLKKITEGCWGKGEERGQALGSHYVSDGSNTTCGEQKGSAGLGSHRPGFRLFVTA